MTRREAIEALLKLPDDRPRPAPVPHLDGHPDRHKLKPELKGAFFAYRRVVRDEAGA